MEILVSLHKLVQVISQNIIASPKLSAVTFIVIADNYNVSPKNILKRTEDLVNG